MAASPTIVQVQPLRAVEGGRLRIEGTNLFAAANGLPQVLIDNVLARVIYASRGALEVLVPPGLAGGTSEIRLGASATLATVEVGRSLATGLHLVDSPVFDREGNLYVTYSGTREHQAPVSIYRVRPDGSQEAFASGIANPTAMAFDAEQRLYVSSRFEGKVYRVGRDGQVETVASDLGVASGLAFGSDGSLFVGDRSGTIFRLSASGAASVHASLPASVAAFHIAAGPNECLYVTAPTLASSDVVYRIGAEGTVSVVATGFGRPQGLGFDRDGRLHVVEALAGESGLYRVDEDGSTTQVLSAATLVGVAFDDPRGGLVVASNEAAYRFEGPSGAV